MMETVYEDTCGLDPAIELALESAIEALTRAISLCTELIRRRIESSARSECFDTAATRDLGDAVVYIGDCLESLRTVQDQSVHCCVTSPPYFGLRDYGVDGQIGMESTPDEFVAAMVAVFREVKRVLRDDGTLWLNLGDSYASGGRSTRDSDDKLPQRVMGVRPKAGLKPKDLIGIPWRVAFALQSDGWYLRQDIIWHKPNPMPESVKDRCTKAHEYVFLLSKSPRYFFDSEAMKEPAICGAKGSEFHTGKTGQHQLGRAQKVRPSAAKGTFAGKTEAMADTGQNAFRAIVEMRNRRSVWSVSTRPYKGAHFATFPPDLIEPCILAGCPKGGVVLDPFGGSGTTAGVAIAYNRKAVLCELNPGYAELIPARIETIVASYINPSAKSKAKVHPCEGN